jgi:hypothetical protein
MMHSNPFSSSSSHATEPLELLQSDLHGPLPVSTKEGYRYWMTFIEDATLHRAAMQLKQKSDTFEAFPGSSINLMCLLFEFGAAAYVFIQNDKRCSLEPHMKKCIFVGYLTGYKGWKFYNPNTQKYIISEHAEFDEHVFPGLAKLHHQLISEVPILLLV